MTEILIRNRERDKDKYMIYTDEALYINKEKSNTERMGISWIQVGKRRNWPEEEIAL